MSEHAPESVPVQLTRMEGKLDLVQQRLIDLLPRVDRLDADMAQVQMTTQRLDLEAKARDETAIALAVALKDAKEQQEATARQEAAKEAARDGQRWSPMQRLVLVGGAALALVQIYQAIVPGS